MPAPVNRIGETWDKYVVIGEAPPTISTIGTKSKRYYVKCLDCDHIFILSKVSVRKKRKTPCPNCDLPQTKIGDTFGRWTIVGDSIMQKSCPTAQWRRKYWPCKCLCGTERLVSENRLLRGISTSCGCKTREAVHERNFIDITGQKFGRLLVVEYLGSNTHNKSIWKCLCECGRFTTMVAGNLKNGTATQCWDCAVATRALAGKDHWNWQGGKTSLNKRIRDTKEMKVWVSEVLAKDNYTCQFSNITGGELEVHHIKPFAQILHENNIRNVKEARNCAELWDVSNGITLAKEFHSNSSENPLSFHRIYSTICFTQEDFKRWFMQLGEWYE